MWPLTDLRSSDRSTIVFHSFHWSIWLLRLSAAHRTFESTHKPFDLAPVSHIPDSGIKQEQHGVWNAACGCTTVATWWFHQIVIELKNSQALMQYLWFPRISAQRQSSNVDHWAPGTNGKNIVWTTRPSVSSSRLFPFHKFIVSSKLWDDFYLRLTSLPAEPVSLLQLLPLVMKHLSSNTLVVFFLLLDDKRSKHSQQVQTDSDWRTRPTQGLSASYSMLNRRKHYGEFSWWEVKQTHYILRVSDVFFIVLSSL